MQAKTLTAAMRQIAESSRGEWPKYLRDEDLDNWSAAMTKRVRQQARFINQAAEGFLNARGWA
eukprot:630359-Alexandrium_andersonii.AAC.1